LNGRLGFNIPTLCSDSSLGGNMGLPGWRAVCEDFLDFLERFTRCLREGEENVDCHGGAESTKDCGSQIVSLARLGGILAIG
jgi:hypothetical protein